MIELPEEKVAKLRDHFIQLSCQPRHEIIRKVAQQMAELDGKIVQYQRALVDRIRELEVKKLESAAMQIQPSVELKGAEFDNLLLHPDIHDIELEGYRITVTTKPIKIEYSGELYFIGRFQIILEVGSTPTCLLRFKNLDQSIQGHAHPHIESNGVPCLGNIKECMPQMIGANQFAAAINVAIQYLKSYTYDGTGKPYITINRWPKINRENEKEKANEVSRGVDRAEGVAEEDRAVVGAVGEQRQDAGGGGALREPVGVDQGDQQNERGTDGIDHRDQQDERPDVPESSAGAGDDAGRRAVQEGRDREEAQHTGEVRGSGDGASEGVRETGSEVRADDEHPGNPAADRRPSRRVQFIRCEDTREELGD